MEDSTYEPSSTDRLLLALDGLFSLIMYIGVGISVLALGYLLLGLLGGGLAGYPSLPHDARLKVLSNLAFAGNALRFSLAVAALSGAFAYRNEESTGYILLIGSILIGVGIPFGVRSFNAAQIDNPAFAASLVGFINACYIPAGVGAILVARDIVLRLIGAVRDKPIKHEEMQYGGGAASERRPVRTSLMAKCWEGGFCRDFIRPHCPIFIARKACWREKRGCYCEEDIVNAATSKVDGIVLDMAPDAKYNFANPSQPGIGLSDVGSSSGGGGLTIGRPIGGGAPVAIGGGASRPVAANVAGTYRRVELTMAQKVQRCKHCVIYNEHQAEKYKLLLPVTAIGGLALCFLASPFLLHAVDMSLTMMQTVVDRASFGVSSGAKFTHPGETVEWIFFGAFTVMIVSKMLQMLEWACFTAKI